MRGLESLRSNAFDGHEDEELTIKDTHTVVEKVSNRQAERAHSDQAPSGFCCGDQRRRRRLSVHLVQVPEDRAVSARKYEEG